MCKQCKHVTFKVTIKNGPYKNQHTEQHKNTQNTQTQQTFRKKLVFVFLDFSISIYNFFNNFSKQMLRYRLGMVSRL